MKPYVITIARQYGSGGKTVGKMLADKLGIPFYNREIITMASEDSGVNAMLFSDERLKGDFLTRLRAHYHGNTPVPNDSSKSYLKDEALFAYQVKIIRRLADQGPCVMIGRCADYILAGRPDVVRVFVHADKDFCLEQAMKVDSLPENEVEKKIAEKMGMDGCYPVSGQTYSRKVDTRVMNILAGIAASAHKFSNDIRLLQHLKEVEEPFEKTQIGSSAMAYKRNPMRSERIASLSRYVMIDALNPAITSATQWFERTLDDSANKRLSIPEGFLAIDGILDLCLNVVDGLVVYPKVIEKRLMSELPFMATENIMMDAVKAGGDRQELHERIRELSMEAGKNVKEKGLDNNLLELIAADPAFNLTLEDLQKTMQPEKYVGRAKEQVEAYLTNVINPLLEKNQEVLGVKAEINV